MSASSLVVLITAIYDEERERLGCFQSRLVVEHRKRHKGEQSELFGESPSYSFIEIGHRQFEAV